jgi:predicted nucleic acid-binding protein
MIFVMEIPALVKVLVDTSVWIEFFRRRDPYYSIVARMIDNEQVCLAGIILAELMQGAKSEKELAVLAEFPKVFDFIPEMHQLWSEAGLLAYNLRRKGITIGLSDCYIAVAAALLVLRLLHLMATLKLSVNRLKSPCLTSLRLMLRSSPSAGEPLRCPIPVVLQTQCKKKAPGFLREPFCFPLA